MSKLLQIENLSVSYDKKVVLRDVSLTVNKLDFLGIIGPNGGGKTTLIKTILGLKSPDKGKISFFKEGQKVERIKIGYLPQYNNIDKKFPISVRETILSGLSGQKSLLKRFSRQQLLKVEETIERMGLTGLEERPIGQLSGGQMQRALLGRAVVSDPDIVVLDEPSTYIDKQFEAKLYELLKEINKERAILLVSHDINTVKQNAKAIVHIVNCQLSVDNRPLECRHTD